MSPGIRRAALVLRPEPAAFARVFGSDLGEDWVVPKEPLRYLVIRGIAAGVVVTGFDGQGNLVADRYFTDQELAAMTLSSLVAQGIIGNLRDIPDSAGSVLMALETGRRPGGS